MCLTSIPGIRQLYVNYYETCVKKKIKLWVQWVHEYYGKKRPILEITPRQASWIVQKIAQARLYIEDAGLTMTEVVGWKTFSIRKLYQTMRGRFQWVSWRNVVCNNFGAPKWLFILTLAAKRRLLTRDRLANWRITDNVMGPLCNNEAETIDHLFFKCVVSAEIWSKLLQWQGKYKQVLNWQEELL